MLVPEEEKEVDGGYLSISKNIVGGKYPLTDDEGFNVVFRRGDRQEKGLFDIK